MKFLQASFKNAVFLSSLLMSAEALASTTSSVGSPNVSEGKSALAFRLGYSEADETSSEDERVRTRIHYDYGVTDFYAVRLQIAGDDRKGNNFEHDDITFVNRFHVLKKEQHGFDFGFRLGYTHKDGDKKADAVSLGFYQLFANDNWEYRFNELFDHEVGKESDSGLQFAVRSQATYKVSDTHRFGLEMFNDFDNLTTQSGYQDHSHTIGPVLKGKIFDGFSYETGYRAGISEGAPDHSVKFFIEKAF